MIIRQGYIETIRPFLGRPIVKAITGLRRVGKSVFIRQLMDELRRANVPDSNIIYVDMYTPNKPHGEVDIVVSVLKSAVPA